MGKVAALRPVRQPPRWGAGDLLPLWLLQGLAWGKDVLAHSWWAGDWCVGGCSFCCPSSFTAILFLRLSSSWLAPTRTITPPCQTTTQTGAGPLFTGAEASSMGRCGTALLEVSCSTTTGHDSLMNAYEGISICTCLSPSQVCQTSTTYTLTVWRSLWSSAVTNSQQSRSFTQNGRETKKLCSVSWSPWVSEMLPRPKEKCTLRGRNNVAFWCVRTGPSGDKGNS